MQCVPIVEQSLGVGVSRHQAKARHHGYITVGHIMPTMCG